jgi:hypothetical protein
MTILAGGCRIRQAIRKIAEEFEKPIRDGTGPDRSKEET